MTHSTRKAPATIATWRERLGEAAWMLGPSAVGLLTGAVKGPSVDDLREDWMARRRKGKGGKRGPSHERDQ